MSSTLRNERYYLDFRAKQRRAGARGGAQQARVVQLGDDLLDGLLLRRRDGQPLLEGLNHLIAHALAREARQVAVRLQQRLADGGVSMSPRDAAGAARSPHLVHSVPAGGGRHSQAVDRQKWSRGAGALVNL